MWDNDPRRGLLILIRPPAVIFCSPAAPLMPWSALGPERVFHISASDTDLRFVIPPLVPLIHSESRVSWGSLITLPKTARIRVFFLPLCSFLEPFQPVILGCTALRAKKAEVPLRPFQKVVFGVDALQDHLPSAVELCSFVLHRDPRGVDEG